MDEALVNLTEARKELTDNIVHMHGGYPHYDKIVKTSSDQIAKIDEMIEKLLNAKELPHDN